VTPDEIVSVKPKGCRHCGEQLSGEDAEPQRHQVMDVPIVKPQDTEYQLHALTCAGCGRRTRAELPANVSWSAFGPRLMSIASLCTGEFHLSKRATEKLMRDLLGVQISLGSVSNIERIVSNGLAEPHAEALACVRRARAAHLDETSWVEDKKTAWLWNATCHKASVFLIRPNRSAAIAKEILGRHFRGVLISDDYGGYNWMSIRRRQLCWAHLIRHFCSLLDLESAKAFGERLLDFARRMFSAWHSAKTRPAFRALAPPLQTEFHEILVQGASHEHRRVRSLCKRWLKREPALWNFVHDDATEPTNNAAERALRPAVIWRKLSFGTASQRGSRFAERMLSVVATLRIYGRNVLDYLTAACANFFAHQNSPPLLLPGA
jgi:transposase